MRISDEVLVHPDRSLWLFHILSPSGVSQLSSPSSLGWFSSFSPLAAQKMAVVASKETSIFYTASGPCHRKMRKKTMDIRCTGQAWILDFWKTQLSAIPLLENAIHIPLHVNSDAQRTKTFSYNATRNANCFNCFAPRYRVVFFPIHFRLKILGRQWNSGDALVCLQLLGGCFADVSLSAHGHLDPWGMGEG